MKKIYTILLLLFITSFAFGTTYHTISIDGTNDFASDEDVAGTSGSAWYFTWDDTNFYFGTSNADIQSGSDKDQKWVLLYIDSDPNLVPTDGTGTTTGLMYTTQQPSLPFTANYHLRWKLDNTYISLEAWNGVTWAAGNQTGISVYQSGSFVEFKIPRSNIGSPSAIYLCGTMINEKTFSEWSYNMIPGGQSDRYDPDFSLWLSYELNSGVSPDNADYRNKLLPVELVSFTAHTAGNAVKLNWETETEINNYGFEIERASTSSATGWEKVGFVQGSGKTNSPKLYSFLDSAPPAGNVQYRLKQIDLDGVFSYYTTIAEINISLTGVKERQVPEEFSLAQNYPNPFNPVTRIKYSIAQAGYTTLKVYNALGTQVAVIVNGYKQPGFYDEVFNAGNLTSGVYFYRLESGSFTKVKKFVLLR